MSRQDAEPPNFYSPANLFLQREVYRLGAEPGLRSLPPGPERDFLTLTWGPIIYRTTYAPDSQRLFLLFLRGLNEEVRKTLPRVLQGSPEQLSQLEQCYSSKVVGSQETMHQVDEMVVREMFRDWKIALAIPVIELPVRLRMCLVVDNGVLATMTGMVNEASRKIENADLSRCPVKVLEENHLDSRNDGLSSSPEGEYPGWTTMTLGALVEIYDGLRQGKCLIDYHEPGRMYLGGGRWT